MPIKNPPHPGHSIKDACLDPLGLSVTAGARVLGVARHTLPCLERPSRDLGGDGHPAREAGWSNADHWVRLQAAYDLAQARRHQDEIKVERYEHRVALTR
jgi:plasmid maintenance system antidote protein VapI